MGNWLSSGTTADPENMAAAKTLVDDKIASKKVVMFSKSTCPFCARAKELFKKYLGDLLSQDDYEVIEINNEKNTSDIQDYLQKLTGGRTVPRVFINQKFVGGCDDVTALDNKGELKTLLAA